MDRFAFSKKLDKWEGIGMTRGMQIWMTGIWGVLFLVSTYVSTDEERISTTIPIPGVKTQWNGFDRYDFVLDERNCIIVSPDSPLEGNPWIWRARFFGHRPEVDIALLGKGYYLVYMDVVDLYGCPTAVRHWNEFYRYLTEAHGFAKKAALEGMSRGGLIIYNWAAANPEKVSCIYADAPVCDFKSWPAGKGRGKGSPEDWQKCLKAYGVTEEEALAYPYNPIDNLESLAKANIPLLHVHGDADEIVPLEENTRIVEERYKAMGGSIIVIVKPGVGHTHGLDDPTPIVDFILKNMPSK